MPVPEQRDLEATRKRLAAWLAERLPERRGLAVSEITIPGGTGFSNETLMFDVSWEERSGREVEGFVARVHPTGYQLFLEADFELQYRLLQHLEHQSDVPVPPTLWYEADDAVLGAPFFVMRKVPGQAAPDFPNYNAEGWLAEASPEERRRIWHNAMDAFIRVHRIPTEAVMFLNKPELGPTGLDQQLTYWQRSLEWAARGRPQPVAEAAWEWLSANVPAERPTGLSWGDARIGNILVEGVEVRALLDWEMLSLGGHLMDLGWWLFVDRYHAFEVPRLPGLGTRDETITLWEEGTGQKATDLFWYEVFAGLRFAVIMMRLAQMFEAFGLEFEGVEDMETNNGVTHVLAGMLELPPPGPRRGS
jgi:aminoglycoside phosphotransferase (APT) family kinase protein